MSRGENGMHALLPSQWLPFLSKGASGRDDPAAPDGADDPDDDPLARLNLYAPPPPPPEYREEPELPPGGAGMPPEGPVTLESYREERERVEREIETLRVLIRQSERELEAQQQRQAAALREVEKVEERLHYHSREEIRSVYILASEAEMRTFMVSEQLDQAKTKLDAFERYLRFLANAIEALATSGPSAAAPAATAEAGAVELPLPEYTPPEGEGAEGEGTEGEKAAPAHLAAAAEAPATKTGQAATADDGSESAPSAHDDADAMSAWPDLGGAPSETAATGEDGRLAWLWSQPTTPLPPPAFAEDVAEAPADTPAPPDAPPDAPLPPLGRNEASAADEHGWAADGAAPPDAETLWQEYEEIVNYPYPDLSRPDLDAASDAESQAENEAEAHEPDAGGEAWTFGGWDIAGDAGEAFKGEATVMGEATAPQGTETTAEGVPVPSSGPEPAKAAVAAERAVAAAAPADQADVEVAAPADDLVTLAEAADGAEEPGATAVERGMMVMGPRSTSLGFREGDDARRLSREALRRVVQAQEEVAERAAQEMQAGAVQSLMNLSLEVGMYEQMAQANPAAALEGLEHVRSLVNGLLHEHAETMLRLRPLRAGEHSFVAALRRYAMMVSSQRHIAFELVAPNGEVTLPPEVATPVFRVAQEALQNAARHSQGTLILVVVNFLPERLSLTVEDDGVGFDARRVMARAYERGRGGLIGMLERAELLGGWLRVESSPGEGCLVELNIPLEGE